MTEQDIINEAFVLTELDSDFWAPGTDEYETARVLLNMGIGRWENYQNTRWRELLTTFNSSSASEVGGDRETDGSRDYETPVNFVFPGSVVRTTNSAGHTTRWRVIRPELAGKYESQYVCWFTGNKKAGYTLHFNISPDTEQEIEYEYYRAATRTSSPLDEVEISDPSVLSYFIAAHLGEDGEVRQDLFQIAEARLEQLRETNMSGVFGNPDEVEDIEGVGFGR